MRGAGPAAYATNLARWAGNDAAKLHGALLSGNGKTKNAFMRRLSDDQLRTLHNRVAGKAGLAGIRDDYETHRELRRRGLDPAASKLPIPRDRSRGGPALGDLVHTHDGRTYKLEGMQRYASGGNGVRRPEGWSVRPRSGGRARVMGVNNFSHYTPKGMTEAEQLTEAWSAAARAAALLARREHLKAHGGYTAKHFGNMATWNDVIMHAKAAHDRGDVATVRKAKRYMDSFKGAPEYMPGPSHVRDMNAVHAAATATKGKPSTHDGPHRLTCTGPVLPRGKRAERLWRCSCGWQVTAYDSSAKAAHAAHVAAAHHHGRG